MNEWASKFMSVLPNNNPKTDFNKFIKEVKAETKEHLSFQKDFDEDIETRPTYEQISLELILDEANKNILLLKSLEYILTERVQAYQQFFNTLSKAKASFDVFQHCEGSLRQSLDSFYLFVEQELQQARQQISLSDIRRSLSEMKVEAQKKLNDYMKEIANAEKDVNNCEKKLLKSKEQLDKYMDIRTKLTTNNENENNSTLKFTKDLIKSTNSIYTIKETEEHINKYNKEIKDDIKSLQQSILTHDQIIQASRKAYQQLDYNCKKVIHYILKKIIIHEKEFNISKNLIFEKFDITISRLDIENDINEFISVNRQPESSLILQSEAINILNDINPIVNRFDDSISISGNSNINDIELQPTDISTDHSTKRHNSNIYPSIFKSSTNIESSLSNQLMSAFGSASSIFNNGSSNSSNQSTPASPQSNTQLDLPIDSKPYSYSMYTTNQSSSHPSNNITNYHSQMNQVITNLTNEFELYLNTIFHSKKSLNIENDTIDSQIDSSTNNLVDISNTNLLSNPSANISLILKYCHDFSIQVNNNYVNTSSSSNPVDRRKQSLHLEEAVSWLAYGTESQQGRDIFITELNKFRSKKVDISEGFLALGTVLWAVLEHCYRANDIHCAKIVMMLSQTFYRQNPNLSTKESNDHKKINNSSSQSIDLLMTTLTSDDEDDEGSRVVGRREYIKDLLLLHPIWQEGQFWELVLRDCAYEQLQTIPYDIAWYDLDKDKREEMVQRVHNVIFSQVMAITHSMMEFKCQISTIREFVYRMCVIHQLSEAQRQTLLLHLLSK